MLRQRVEYHIDVKDKLSGGAPSAYQSSANMIVYSTPRAADGSQRDYGSHLNFSSTNIALYIATCPPLLATKIYETLGVSDVMAARPES